MSYNVKYNTYQTNATYRIMLNDYKFNGREIDRNERYTREHLYRHFSCQGHDGFLEALSNTLINKTHASDPMEENI